MALTPDEKQKLLDRVSAFESATGIELVTALVPRCDDYPEIPWKAFALGAAAGALYVLLATGWPTLGWPARISDVSHGWADDAAFTAVLIVLAFGLASTALSFWLPPYGRWFLATSRAAGETQQAAQTMFLDHELFGTRSRTGMLMLITTFERRVVLLADRGLREALPFDSQPLVIAAMMPALRAGRWAESFAAGIEKLESLAREAGFSGGPSSNTLPDHLDTHRDEGDSC